MTKEKKKKKGGKRGDFLSSLQLTIPLLILLAALSVIGTVIPQNASEQEYIRLYNKETYYVFKGLGLLDMYRSWWFIGSLMLLAINLIACSVKRLPGVWQHVRKTKRGYARLGTYLTHLGVLLILAGGLTGAVWGFKGYVEIMEGETAQEIFIRNSHQGMRPLGFAVRCDSFHVDFYPNGSPREYVSTLTFFEGEQVALDHAPLLVNHPLSYGGLTFYQSSYGISSRAIIEVRTKAGTGIPSIMQLSQGEVRPIPGTDAQIGFMKYQEGVHGLGDAVLLVLFTPGASPEGFWIFTRHAGRAGRQMRDFSFILKGLEKRYYTGLQVTRDPGVPIVWAGCSLLVTGMVVTFALRRPAKKQSSRGR